MDGGLLCWVWRGGRGRKVGRFCLGLGWGWMVDEFRSYQELCCRSRRWISWNGYRERASATPRDFSETRSSQ